MPPSDLPDADFAAKNFSALEQGYSHQAARIRTLEAELTKYRELGVEWRDGAWRQINEPKLTDAMFVRECDAAKVRVAVSRSQARLESDTTALAWHPMTDKPEPSTEMLPLYRMPGAVGAECVAAAVFTEDGEWWMGGKPAARDGLVELLGWAHCDPAAAMAALGAEGHGAV